METATCETCSDDRGQGENYPRDMPATLWLPGMNPANLITYGEMRALFLDALPDASSGLPQVTKNALTALNGWLSYVNATDAAYIGQEFGSAFDATLAKHLEDLRQSGRSFQTLKDRKSKLLAWRQRYVAMSLSTRSGDRGLSKTFAEALQAAIEESGKTQDALAREASVDPTMFSRWLNGHVPGPRSARAVQRVERVLGLHPGTLGSLTSGAVPITQESSMSSPDPYIERLRHTRKLEYRLKDVPEALKAEWLAFLRYKTTFTPSVLGLKRHKVAVWRCKNAVESTLSKLDWFSTTRSGQACVAADLAWQSYARAYLGWMCIDAEKGGRGFDAEKLSLALFSDALAISEFTEWKRERSGGIYHSGIRTFAAFCASLTNPKTGYLVQVVTMRHAICADLSEGEWLARCQAAYSAAKEIQNAPGDRTQKSRDPTVPVRAILDMPEPKLALFELEERLEVRARAATPGSKVQAKAVRDLLLMKFMVRNPLRAHSFKIMRYKEDNSGNLYQRSDGSWWLRFVPQSFKNERGAAKRPYDEQIETDLYPLIQLYLSSYRPLLDESHASDFVFVSMHANNQPWHGLNATVAKLLWRYMPGMTRATGPHVVRHIVATDYLKRCPGAYASVSHLLYDTLQTVLKEYGHLQACDVRRQVEEMDRGLRDDVRRRMKRS